MKMNKLKICTTLLVMILIFQSFAQTTIDISKYNCLSAPIKYTVEGEQKEGLLFFVNYKDRETPVLQYSNAYILNKNGQNIQIAGDSTAFTSVYEMKVSKNSMYLAVYMVGEGHPWIEIYDLQKMINVQKQDMIADINPYPGNIDLIGWQNESLIIESDINLLLKNENKDLSDKDIFAKPKKYLFSLSDKKYKEIK